MSTLYKLIIYSGLAAFTFLCLAFAPFVLKVNFKYHKIFGMLAFAFSALHFSLFLYRQYRLKTHKR